VIIIWDAKSLSKEKPDRTSSCLVGWGVEEEFSEIFVKAN
jgi:hypothetical protein